MPDEAGVGDPAEGYFAGLSGKLFAHVLQELWTEVSPTGAYWNPTRLLSDSRLPALASDESRYVFSSPSDQAVSVRARLLFRRSFTELMDQKSWDVPDLLMEEWRQQLD